MHEVGQTSFTKHSQFGAEVFFTDASLPFFDLESVDATEAVIPTAVARLLKARFAPMRSLSISAIRSPLPHQWDDQMNLDSFTRFVSPTQTQRKIPGGSIKLPGFLFRSP
jgi:hypothetical protein